MLNIRHNPLVLTGKLVEAEDKFKDMNKKILDKTQMNKY